MKNISIDCLNLLSISKLFVGLLLCLNFYISSSGQVSLIPTSLFVTDNPGVTSLEVRNPLDKIQEVSIDFAFAYLGNDSIGRPMMKEDLNGEAELRDISKQIRAFPRKFILSPYSRQIVRFQIISDSDRPDMMYWTRVIISTGIVTDELNASLTDSVVGTKVSFFFKQNIPLFYKRGEVSTGLTIGSVKIFPERNQLIALAGLQPLGNAPFNGSVTIKLSYADGELITQQHTSCVLYFETLRRIELPLPEEKLPPGSYNVELLFETKRGDILPSCLVQADPVHYFSTLKIE